MEVPKLSRIAKWLVLVGAYFWAVGLCVGSALIPLAFSRNDFVQFLGSGLSCILPVLIIGGLMGLVYFTYKKDLERETSPSDDFKEDKLFFRYGYRLNHTTLTIPTKDEWGETQIRDFVGSLQQTLAKSIQNRFVSANVEITFPLTIKDKSLTLDERDFLKISFHSRRGSHVVHFVRYEITGKLIVAHFFTYVRGKYVWHDVVDFVITGPLHFWIWILDWFQNQYSVVSRISSYVKNSYDQIDLETYFEASYLALLDETRTVLKEEGLLSEDLERVISVNIDNSQNINVSGSQGVSVGNILNRVQGASGRASKADR